MKNKELQQRVDTYHSNQGKNRGHLEQLGLDFHGVELDGRNLAAAVIPAADFSGMTLRDVDFAGANLGGANFSNATLIDVIFVKANLDHANFTNTTVIGGSWFRATCVNSEREGLTFSGTNIERVYPDLI